MKLPGSGAEALCPRSTWNGDEMTWPGGQRRATDDEQTALTNGRRRESVSHACCTLRFGPKRTRKEPDEVGACHVRV